MSTADKNDNPKTIAERLGNSYLELRADLEISRHVLQGKAVYFIRDGITCRNHQISLQNYEILISINSEQSLSETFDDLVKNKKLTKIDEDAFYQFIVSLHQNNFLALPVQDSKSLYRRSQIKKKAARSQLWLAPIFFRLPLIDPNTFLDRTVRYVKPLFTIPALLVWILLVGVAAIVVYLQADKFAEPLNNLLVARNIPTMWLILIGLKLIHEAGHAYSCKAFGGVVPEAGLYIMACTPCTYVDTSSTWGFSKKRHRLTVCLAGMYFELAIAAVAALVWSMTAPGLVNSIAYQITLLAGIMTVIFNINPLMRYDGYYVLSDLLEVPNLRQRSTEQVKAVTKRLLLGLRSNRLETKLWLKLILFAYGIAYPLYRVAVILGIATLIATKVFLAGIALAGVYITKELYRVSKPIILFLLTAPETQAIRPRAIATFLVLVITIAGVLFAPMPSSVSAGGVLGKENEAVVRAGVSGMIQHVHAAVHLPVTKGAMLVCSENADIEMSLIDAMAKRDASEIRLRAVIGFDNIQAQQERERLGVYQKQLGSIQKSCDQLIINAPASGQIVQSITPADEGRFIHAGEPVARIVSGKWIIKVLLTEEEFARCAPAIDTAIGFRSISAPGVIIKGFVMSVSPAASYRTDLHALTQFGGGNIVVDPQTGETNKPYFEIIAMVDSGNTSLRHGMTGKVIFDAPWRTISHSVFLKLVRFTNNMR